MENYGLEVGNFTIMVGWKRWYIIRAYVPPNYQRTVDQVEQSWRKDQQGWRHYR